MKCAGARSAGNPHAACDVAGAGDGATVGPTWARRGKPRIRTRVHPDGQPRQLSTLPHYCRTTRNGKFGLGRKPVGKRVDQTLRRIGAELRRRMHHNPYEVAKWLGKILNGWLRYYAVPTSSPSLRRFAFRLRRMWLRVLRRRSQMDRTKLDKLGRVAAAFWPPVVANPASMARTAVCRQTPEVGAPCVSAHAGKSARGAVGTTGVPTVTLPVPDQLAGSRNDDDRNAASQSTTRRSIAGSAFRPGNGEAPALAVALATVAELAHRRDLRQGPRPVGVSVPCARQAREHDRFLSLGDPQHQGREAIPRQGAERVEGLGAARGAEYRQGADVRCHHRGVQGRGQMPRTRRGTGR